MATVSPSNAFTAKPVLGAGANSATVNAVSGGGTPGTSSALSITINSLTPSTLTHDAVGNMTSNGTDSYAWDAADRLITVTYPGSGNSTALTYDALNDGSGTLVKQFFPLGQMK